MAFAIRSWDSCHICGVALALPACPWPWIQGQGSGPRRHTIFGLSSLTQCHALLGSKWHEDGSSVLNGIVTQHQSSQPQPDRAALPRFHSCGSWPLPHLTRTPVCWLTSGLPAQAARRLLRPRLVGGISTGRYLLKITQEGETRFKEILL